MIPLRAWIIPILAAVVLIAVGVRARAADTPAYTCADIRAAVKTIQTASSVSRQKAIDILEGVAKGNGATKEQIETAKRCLQ